jgi:hypothetical protein
MSITTLKRFQSNKNWWFTLEDCNAEVDNEPKTGSRLLLHEQLNKSGEPLFSLNLEDTLLLRDSLNQLYPIDRYPSK